VHLSFKRTPVASIAPATPILVAIGNTVERFRLLVESAKPRSQRGIATARHLENV
jgi:hypothetical protein